MASQISLLSAVDGQQDAFKVRVRVVRRWSHQTSSPYSQGNVEMVFVDEEGNKMQGTIKKTYMAHFEGLLCEGEVYVISNFGVAANQSRFKMIPNPHKIYFHRRTKVVSSPGPFAGPLFGFNFADYDAVEGLTVDQDLAIDMIGVLYSCGKIQNKMVDGRKCKLISFELKSIEGKKVDCALWDSFAEQLADHVSSHNRTDPIVVIIHFCRVTEFNAHGQVSNCFYGTRVLLDAPVAEGIVFRDAYLARNGGQNHQQGVRQYIGKGEYSILDDFVISTPKKTVDGLRCNTLPGKYILVGKIIEVRMNPTWVYLSCHKCYSGVLPADSNTGLATSGNTTSVGMWDCKKCGLNGVDVVWRFRIQVRVQDSTGTVSLTLFDRDVSGAVKKSTKEIYAKLPKGEEEDTLPQS